MDQTIPEIQFDEKGECQFCKIHDVLEMKYPLGNQGEVRLENVIQKIKQAGRGKPYDCLCGTSGGRDSTWTLFLAKKYGLRPLAVHFDNGWNSEVAVRNIKNATDNKYLVFIDSSIKVIFILKIIKKEAIKTFIFSI
jgi:tRNA(Ile)-lysidine synthase TilS/MesJ